MSGLLRGVGRWPSWVFAYVSGTNLFGVLEAHDTQRYCLNCWIDHSLSHHAVQRFLPDQPGSCHSRPSMALISPYALQ
jgi:hypothetical protein